MKHHRCPKTTQEKREAQENQELIRGSRHSRQLPSAWDDINRGRGKYDSSYRHFKRWLAKQVGRPYSEVFSEIVQKFGEDGRQWCQWFIDREFQLIDGVPWGGRWGNFYPFYSTQKWPVYFEHPETKIFSRSPNKPPKPPKTTNLDKIKTNDPMHEYWKIAGIWYECWLAEQLIYYWSLNGGHKKLVVKTKRQLNKKELKFFGVKNDILL